MVAVSIGKFSLVVTDYVSDLHFPYCFHLVPVLLFESFKSKPIKHLQCSVGLLFISLFYNRLHECCVDVTFSFAWIGSKTTGMVVCSPFPSFTHWHNFYPTKLFKNKEGKGFPVQASCESCPDIKDLCKSLAGNPSICHLVTSLFYAIIPCTANESQNQSNFHSFSNKKF